MGKVVYFATMPILYTGGVSCTHKVGYFAEKEDAVMSSKIVENILSKRKGMVEYSGYYSISRKTIADNDQAKVYNSVQEFLTNNTHVIRYVKDKGQDALDAIVNQTLESENALSR